MGWWANVTSNLTLSRSTWLHTSARLCFSSAICSSIDFDLFAFHLIFLPPSEWLSGWCCAEQVSSIHRQTREGVSENQETKKAPLEWIAVMFNFRVRHNLIFISLRQNQSCRCFAFLFGLIRAHLMRVRYAKTKWAIKLFRFEFTISFLFFFSRCFYWNIIFPMPLSSARFIQNSYQKNFMPVLIYLPR